jgi:hypothetical protein
MKGAMMSAKLQLTALLVVALVYFVFVGPGIEGTTTVVPRASPN